MVGAAMLPSVIGSLFRPEQAGIEQENLRFYGELAAARDPAVSFPAPKAPPRISSRPANPVAEWIAHGRVHNIRFTSSFEAVNPAMRERCGGFQRNNVVHAQHWRHDDGPHPTLCVIHGFLGSAYLAQRLVLVAAVVLPVRLRRAALHPALSRQASREVVAVQRLRLLRGGAPGFAEAMAQAVHDFRSLLDYLEFTGVDRIALTGMSLGGYTSALLAVRRRADPGGDPERSRRDAGSHGRRVVPRQQGGRAANRCCRTNRPADRRGRRAGTPRR